MSESTERPLRNVAIADHIWTAFDAMAREMGSDRDGLVNQAMFMFARLNGFLDVAARLPVATEAIGAAVHRALDAEEPGREEPAFDEELPAPGPEAHDDDPEPEAHGYESEDEASDYEAEGEDGDYEPEASEEEAPEPEPVEEEQPEPTPIPAPAPVHQRRTLPPSAIERPRPPPRVEQADPPVLAARGREEAEPRRRMTEIAPSLADDPPGRLDDDPVRREVAERVLETAAELERLIKGNKQGTAVDAAPGPSVQGKGLFLVVESGDPEKVAKDRFLIGRGKHCDYVINSGKVSREHAAILREGAEYFIEDLGSSNGTWFNKARLKRRKIEDGDEYFICSERIRFVVR